MHILHALEPIVITMPTASRRNIGVVRIKMVPARRFRCADIILVFIKERIIALPMGLTDITGFIAGLIEHIGEAVDVVTQMILAGFMAIVNHPVLPRPHP